MRSYSSTTTFAVSEIVDGDQTQSISDTDDAMHTLQETCMSLLESEPFVAKALSDAGYPSESPAAFIRNKLDTEKKQGLAVEVRVRTEDPDKSYAVAKSINDLLKKTMPQLSQHFTVVILEEPVKAIKVNNKTTAGILGVVLGFLLSLLYITISGLVTLRIRDRSDIALVTDIPVLVDSDYYPSTDKGIKYLRDEVIWNLNEESGNTLVVSPIDTNEKNPLYALHIAAAIAKDYKKTAVIDIGGIMTKKLGVNTDPVTSEANNNGGATNLEKQVQVVTFENSNIAYIHTDCWGETSGYDSIDKLIKIVRSNYDYTIVGTGAIESTPEGLFLSRMYKTVLILDKKKIKLDKLKTVMDSLTKSYDNIIGIVLCD